MQRIRPEVGRWCVRGLWGDFLEHLASFSWPSGRPLGEKETDILKIVEKVIIDGD